MNYTKGPWIQRGKFIEAVGGHTIATCGMETRDYKIIGANARLIAAAPDLYEACQAALECLENNGFGKAYVEDILRAAIKKAEG